jgi:hypothetical protein
LNAAVSDFFGNGCQLLKWQMLLFKTAFAVVARFENKAVRRGKIKIQFQHLPPFRLTGKMYSFSGEILRKVL